MGVVDTVDVPEVVLVVILEDVGVVDTVDVPEIVVVVVLELVLDVVCDVEEDVLVTDVVIVDIVTVTLVVLEV